MGLKATNAFWNPRYFDPLTPTITKQLIYVNTKQLLDEVRSLVWLGLLTNRSVIIPNVLGSDAIPDDTIQRYKGQRLWPGFRVLFLKRKDGKTIIPINILEPGFYWRISRDYEAPPEPSVLFFDPITDDMEKILKNVLDSSNVPRIVLHSSRSSNIRPDKVQLGENNKRWGNDRTPPDRRGLPIGTSFLRLRNRHRRLDLLEPCIYGQSSDLDLDPLLEEGGTEPSCNEQRHTRTISISSDFIKLSRANDINISHRVLTPKSDAFPSSSMIEETSRRVATWSKDSVGLFTRAFLKELMDYGIIPSVKAARQLSEYIDTTNMVIDHMRTCEGIFAPLKGNRTCFQICD